jgi:hypothetical protein
VKSLRYGQLMIMTDQARARMLACMRLLACACLLACSLALRACMLTWHGCAQDHDGSHIKGLLINFLHAHFPSLLKARFRVQRACACSVPVLLRCVALTRRWTVLSPGLRSRTFWWSSSRPSLRPPRASSASCSTPCRSARAAPALAAALLLRCCCVAACALTRAFVSMQVRDVEGVARRRQGLDHQVLQGTRLRLHPRAQRRIRSAASALRCILR